LVQEWSVEMRVFINSFFIDLLLVVVSPLLLLYSSKELRYNFSLTVKIISVK
jgi:hypothetical protein